MKTKFYDRKDFKDQRKEIVTIYGAGMTSLEKIWERKKTKLFRMLREVRDDLRSGKLEHVPSVNMAYYAQNPRRLFNMNCWIQPINCGTVYCLGGWLESKIRLPRSPGRSPKTKDRGIYELLHGDPALHDLFYPPNPGAREWAEITPAEAAKAVQRFLDGKKPWVTRRAA